MQTSQAIEAILFKLNEPTSLQRICQILGKKEGEVLEGLKNLKESLHGRGIELLEMNGEYCLVTAGAAAQIIEKMVTDEMGRDIGKAGLETLSIILYKGPLSRREIDYIRGVNSTFILRSLMVRGLVERVGPSTGASTELSRMSSGQGNRGPQYRGTSELLTFLGISKIDELPEYNEVRKEIEATNVANE